MERHPTSLIRSRIVQLYVQILLWQKRRALERKAGVPFGKDVKIDLFTDLEGGNRLGERVNVQSTRIGYGTYVAENSILRHSQIGRYCSIGDNVRCGLGTHPSSGFVSTHPAFFSPLCQAGFSYVDTQLFDEMPTVPGENCVVDIGNDVWIGSSVVIMDGIRISDGAIVGANSTVTRDVPPYAICVGSPARVIKYRFNESQRAWLTKFKWWNKDRTWVMKNAKHFGSLDKFIESFGVEKT